MLVTKKKFQEKLESIQESFDKITHGDDIYIKNGFRMARKYTSLISPNLIGSDGYDKLEHILKRICDDLYMEIKVVGGPTHMSATDMAKRNDERISKVHDDFFMQIKQLRKENEKLRAILNEVVDYVYREEEDEKRQARKKD